VHRMVLAGALALACFAWTPFLATTTHAQSQEISSAAAEQYNQAAQAISGGQFAEALPILDKVLQLEPNFARGYFDRGFVKEQMRDFAGAAADYGKACELDPAHTEACIGHGKALYLNDDYEGALKVFTELAENSDNPAVWVQKARAEEKLGMLDVAAASATKATELAPDDADAYYELGSIEYDRERTSKDYDSAIAAYQKALELDPDHVNAFAAHFKLGKMYYRLDQFDKSEAEFTAATEIREDYAPAYIDLGNCRNKLDNAEGAIEAYQKAIDLRAPEPYGMAYYSLARAYYAQDDFEAAIEAYEKSTTDPEFRHADKARKAIASIQDYLEKKRKAQAGGY
jgi:tetratricopeptide (TPR) repeat protein